jgi:hypothetical protein
MIKAIGSSRMAMANQEHKTLQIGGMQALSHVLEHLTMTVTQKVYWWSAYEMSLVLGLKYASELTKERS